MTLVGDTIIHKLLHMPGIVEWSTHPEIMVEIDGDGYIVYAVLYEEYLFNVAFDRFWYGEVRPQKSSTLLGWVAGYGSVDQRTMIDLQFEV
jgi:hypothetical protein